MRALVTGQIGMDRREYARNAGDLAGWRQYLVVAIAAHFFVAAAHAESEYQNLALGVRIPLIGEWTQYTSAEIKEVNERVAALGLPDVQKYDAGFWEGGPESNGQVYMLIQLHVEDLPSATLEEIGESFGAVDLSGVKNQLSQAQIDSDMSQFRLNRSKVRLESTLRIENPDGSRLRGRTFVFLGERGVATIHCYAPDQIAAVWLPRFESIADGVTFQPGFEFTPSAVSTRRSLWERVGVKALTGAIGGGILALIGGVAMQRRGKQSQTEPNQST